MPAPGAQFAQQQRVTTPATKKAVQLPDTAAGGLKVCPHGLIESEQALMDHQLFFELLNSASTPKDKRVTIANWLESKIVPVLVAGRPNTVWLFVHPDYLEADGLPEISREFKKLGLAWHPDFQVVAVADTLLLDISRGNLSGKTIQFRRNIQSAKGDEASLYAGFRDIIEWAFLNEAADVDFQVYRRESRSRIGFSIDGKWVFPDRFRMSSDTLLRMLGLAFQYGGGATDSALDHNVEQQLRSLLELPRCGNERVMLRWASMAADEVFSVTCRLIRLNQAAKARTLQQLGLLPDHLAMIYRALNSDGGAVISSGVVNSGKSTLLATIMSMIPSTRKCVTIEDPVEYFIPGFISNTVSRSLTGEGSDQLKAKLRTLKRTGFNDLLLGEIRDKETGAAAQDVMESGQKLYTTVHAGAAWKIPDRLAGQGIAVPREVLGTPGNLNLLIYQALLPTNCERCAIPILDLLRHSDTSTASYWKNYSERLKRLYGVELVGVRVRNLQGCETCRRPDMPELSGLRGRTAVCEMIEPDEDYCDLVSRADGPGVVRYLQSLRGDIPFDSEVMRGKSALECAIYKATQGLLDPREIEQRFMSFERIEASRLKNKVGTGARSVGV